MEGVSFEKWIDANILNNPLGAICFVLFLVFVVLPFAIKKEAVPAWFGKAAFGLAALAMVGFFTLALKDVGGKPVEAKDNQLNENANGEDPLEQKNSLTINQSATGEGNVNQGVIGEGAKVEINVSTGGKGSE